MAFWSTGPSQEEKNQRVKDNYSNQAAVNKPITRVTTPAPTKNLGDVSNRLTPAPAFEKKGVGIGDVIGDSLENSYIDRKQTTNPTLGDHGKTTNMLDGDRIRTLADASGKTPNIDDPAAAQGPLSADDQLQGNLSQIDKMVASGEQVSPLQQSRIDSLKQGEVYKDPNPSPLMLTNVGPGNENGRVIESYPGQAQEHKENTDLNRGNAVQGLSNTIQEGNLDVQFDQSVGQQQRDDFLALPESNATWQDMNKQFQGRQGIDTSPKPGDGLNLFTRANSPDMTHDTIKALNSIKLAGAQDDKNNAAALKLGEQNNIARAAEEHVQAEALLAKERRTTAAGNKAPQPNWVKPDFDKKTGAQKPGTGVYNIPKGWAIPLSDNFNMENPSQEDYAWLQFAAKNATPENGLIEELQRINKKFSK